MTGLLTIVSGGQAGADRAALDWAIAHGIPHGGWCPAGRRAEDGPLDARYQLTETEGEGYRARTVRNVRDSDATLVLDLGELEGGTLETLRIAERHAKPIRVVQLDSTPGAERVADLRAWLVDNAVQVLNIAARARASGRASMRRHWGFWTGYWALQIDITQKQKTRGMRGFSIEHWCPGKDSNLHGSPR